MADGLKYVGRNVRRNDIMEKATGQLRYLGDRLSGGAARARLILSSVPRGVITSFDTSEAEKVDGVLRIFTPADDPGKKYNSAIFLPDQKDLADHSVFTSHPLFVGDVIGAVLAENDEAARRAAALVTVEYAEEKPLVDILEALEAPSFKEGFPQVVEGTIAYGSGKTSGIEDMELETVVKTQKIHHGAIENHLCEAHMEYGGVLVVESPCQMVFTVRYVLADLFSMPVNRVRVIKTPVGGAFGGKQEVVIEPHCALMSLKTKLPVRLVLDRYDTMVATRTRAASAGRVKISADREGKILHREIDVVVDGGAYATGSHRVTMAMGKKISRLYRIPSQSFLGRTVFTNTTPAGACRGYGSPQIHAITEIQMDILAEKLGMDPGEIRLKNLVFPGDSDPAGGPELGNARVRDCLLRGMETFRWKERRRTPAGEGRFRRGVGLACCTHGNGYFGSTYPDFMSMAMRFCEDGSVLVNAGLHELGNGTLTTIAQIVAEILDLPPERIVVCEGDTSTTPFDVGCVASRVTYVCGACALELAEKLKARFLRQSAAVLGGSAEHYQLKGGRLIDTNSGERWNYGALVCRIAKELREETGEYLHYAPDRNPASYGVHFAETMTDTLTGMVEVTEYLAVHDVGKAINPQLLKGQIYGGVQMGIGMALSEELIYDGEGRPKSASLSRYAMVNAPSMPRVSVLLVEEGEKGGPFGAKSIGEICTVPVAPAIVNSVNCALGTTLTDLPLTPEKILEALSGRNCSSGTLRNH